MRSQKNESPPQNPYWTAALAIAVLFSALLGSLMAEDLEWTFADDANARLIDTKDERHIVDQEGRTLARMHQTEVVRSSTYNKSRTTVFLRLAFKQEPVVGVGSFVRGFPYSRLIIVRPSGRGRRLRATGALLYTSELMKMPERWVQEVQSVSEDGKTLQAKVGERAPGGDIEYRDRTIELYPERFLD
jgi:hypothetical protein